MKDQAGLVGVGGVESAHSCVDSVVFDWMILECVRSNNPSHLVASELFNLRVCACL